MYKYTFLSYDIATRITISPCSIKKVRRADHIRTDGASRPRRPFLRPDQIPEPHHLAFSFWSLFVMFIWPVFPLFGMQMERPCPRKVVALAHNQ